MGQRARVRWDIIHIEEEGKRPGFCYAQVIELCVLAISAEDQTSCVTLRNGHLHLVGEVTKIGFCSVTRIKVTSLRLDGMICLSFKLTYAPTLIGDLIPLVALAVILERVV